MTRSEALKLLGLKEGFSEAALAAAFKDAAMLNHPDHGGEAEDFDLIKQARDRLGPDWAKKRAAEYQNSMDYLINATITEATNELMTFRERRLQGMADIRKARREGANIPFGIQEAVVATNDPITLSAIMPHIVYKLGKDIEDFSESIKASEKKVEMLIAMINDCEQEPDTDITNRYREGLSKRLGDEQDNVKNLIDVRQATQQVKDLFDKQREQSQHRLPLFLSEPHRRMTYEQEN